MQTDSSNYKVAVLAGERVVEVADRQRLESIISGRNVRVIYGGRKIRKIVAVELLDFGECFREPSRGASASKYTHDNENDYNPPRVITFRYLDPRFWVRWTVTGKAT